MSAHNETWSEDDIRELINEFKSRPILWNDTLEVTDKRKKATVWRELANIFNTTVADIQRRTNNLKTTFFDEEKKMKKMKAARRKSYVPWVHHDDLKFLIDSQVDCTSSESDAVSGREDHVEHIVPMQVESSNSPSTLNSRLARSRTLLSERVSKIKPTEEKEETTTFTRRRTIVSETIPMGPPDEEDENAITRRRTLTATRILPSAQKESALSRSRTLLSERASKLFPNQEKDFSKVSSNREPVHASSPSKTSPFSSPPSKIAYYPQLGGVPNYSPSKTFGLGSPMQYSSFQSRVESPSQYSTNLVTETASRISPETDRITKRRRLSNSDESPSQSPTKLRKLIREDDNADENGSIVSQVLSDDFDLFGAFVASEIRNLKLESSRIKLKGMIQRSIVQVTEEDSRFAGK